MLNVRVHGSDRKDRGPSARYRGGFESVSIDSVKGLLVKILRNQEGIAQQHEQIQHIHHEQIQHVHHEQIQHVHHEDVDQQKDGEREELQSGLEDFILSPPAETTRLCVGLFH